MNGGHHHRSIKLEPRTDGSDPIESNLSYHNIDGLRERSGGIDELGSVCILPAVVEDSPCGWVLTRPVDGPVAVEGKRPVGPPQS